MEISDFFESFLSQKSKQFRNKLLDVCFLFWNRFGVDLGAISNNFLVYKRSERESVDFNKHLFYLNKTQFF